MPSANLIQDGDHLYEAVKAGKVPESRLDDMAHRYANLISWSIKIANLARILIPWIASGQNKSYPHINMQSHDLADEINVEVMVFRNEHIDNKEDNYILARKIAAESSV